MSFLLFLSVLSLAPLPLSCGDGDDRSDDVDELSDDLSFFFLFRTYFAVFCVLFSFFTSVLSCPSPWPLKVLALLVVDFLEAGVRPEDSPEDRRDDRRDGRENFRDLIDDRCELRLRER